MTPTVLKIKSDIGSLSLAELRQVIGIAIDAETRLVFIDGLKSSEMQRILLSDLSAYVGSLARLSTL